MTEQTDSWFTFIGKIDFAESRIDHLDLGNMLESHVVLQFVSDACGQRFANQKALTLHANKLHDRRIELRPFLDGDGICPACNGKFHTGLRASAHLADRRNTKCKQGVASGLSDSR